MEIIKVDPWDKSDYIAEVPTYMGKESIRLFAFGFLEMAEHSAGLAVQNACSIDAIVPAILYNMRHSVELFMKFILYDLNVVNEKYPIKGHSVQRLHADHIEMLKIALEREPDSGFHRNEWLGRLKAVVDAIHAVDPDGQSLRYPANGALVANQGGGYHVSTKNIMHCIKGIRSLYHEYDQRNR